MFTPEKHEKIRSEFPILNKLGRGGNPIAYLDYGATSQKPKVVIDTMVDFYQSSNGAVNRGTHLLADESTRVYEEGRYTVAAFINAKADQEVIWTKNATEALNLLAHSLADLSLYQGGTGAHSTDLPVLGPGDKLVLTVAEHHSNLVPWQILAKKTGAKIDYLGLDEEGRIDLGELEKIDACTKLVAFTHVSNVTGAISPVKEIVEQARKVGALVVLDTCQSAAHMPVDVQELGVDFAVFSSHKMLGPTGIGCLWGRLELLEQLPVFLTGGSVVKTVDLNDTTYLPVPNRFEAGSQPVAQIAGWTKALEFQEQIGRGEICKHEQDLVPLLLEQVQRNLPQAKIIGPSSSSNRTGIVAFTVPGIHPHDLGQVLDSHDVAVRVGHHCALPLHSHYGIKASTRASVGITTTTEEIERLGQALKEAIRFFG